MKYTITKIKMSLGRTWIENGKA